VDVIADIQDISVIKMFGILFPNSVVFWLSGGMLDLTASSLHLPYPDACPIPFQTLILNRITNTATVVITMTVLGGW